MRPEQIAVVTNNARKVEGYQHIFAPTPVVQVFPRVDEKIISADVHHDLTRAQTMSLLKATEDLRSTHDNLGVYAGAMEWWVGHEGTGSVVRSIDGTSAAIFHDVHNYLPHMDGLTLEKPQSTGEWFAQVMLSRDQELWLVSGHTMMELGGDFPIASVGVITKAHTRKFGKADVAALRNQIGSDEKLLEDSGAGSISLSRNRELFTQDPLEVWLFENIDDMNSGVRIASVPDWGDLSKQELWRITNGIWPEVAGRLTAQLANR